MDMQKIELQISGMTCSHCVKSVANAIEELDGIATKEIKLESGVADITFDRDKITKADIINAINNTNVYKVVTEKYLNN